jgi:Arc/MetJ-type ribon-helix-helix transcriptional regulator
LIEPDTLDRLTSITARTGLSKSEQIRQGIRWWLESREWPLKGERSEAGEAGEAGEAASWRPRSGSAGRGTAKRRR